MSQGCVGAKMFLAPTNTLFDSYISNDYLGISQRKETIEAGINALKKYGTGAVIIDGVYSQDGDLSKFPEYISVCKKHNCLLMVDDAHGIIGVMGNKGRGKAVHYNCLGQVDIIAGTFSKSFGCIGGCRCFFQIDSIFKILCRQQCVLSCNNTPSNMFCP